jgi:type II secretory ATPase GspE/PulE/Tfp pilus assembly ATPase PilB-like protein
MNKNIIHKLFSHGAESGATSLVINNSKEGLYFNYKFPDGNEQNFSLPDNLGTKLLASLQQILKVYDRGLKTDKSYKLKEKKYNLSFKLTNTVNSGGEKIIIQINRNSNKFHNLKQLGFQKDILLTLQKINNIKSGLVIISSPENGGKSSTLAALLREFDLDSINAYFLEKNPKEILAGINYLCPNQNNWHKLLNHDCDLIIFEDLESNKDWEKVIEASNTGRLVIATVKAQNSFEVILKISELDLAPRLKFNNLKLILNSNLVNLARHKKTKKSSPLTEARSKIAIAELLNLNQKTKKYLIDNSHNYKTAAFWKEFSELITKDGFQALKNDLLKKIKNGSVKK